MIKGKITKSEFFSLTPRQKSPYMLSDSGSIKFLINTQQFTKDRLFSLFKISDYIRRNKKNHESLSYFMSLLVGRTCALYFTQCSTRTYASFSFAAQTLGMNVEEIRDSNMSSMYKGEAELDTLLTLAELSDLIVLRQNNPELTSILTYEIMDRGIDCCLINGGSGSDQHPTQALLELYTIFANRGIFDDNFPPFTVAFVGDLLRSRTARSLSFLLSLFPQVKQLFISPPELHMGQDLLDHLSESNVIFDQCTTSLDEQLSNADVFYMMRIQDEYSATSEKLYKEYMDYYLTIDKVSSMKKEAIIIHPLPRRQEIPIEIDRDPRAKYWEAVDRGKFVRIALILDMFGINSLQKIDLRIYPE